MKKTIVAGIACILTIFAGVTLSHANVSDCVSLGLTPELASVVCGAAAVESLSATGEITSSNSTTIGWTVQAGANQACTTTCTSACVFGVNTAATEADIVDCADATADECLCAGAS